MDPIITVPMLVGALTKALDSAAGEAGKKAWSALAALMAKRRNGSGSEADPAPPLLRPDTRDIEPFAEHLAALAAADPAFADGLRAWADNTSVTCEIADSTVNIISGAVHGNVVQGGNMSGTFNLGSRA
jgi:hypothetical protein